MSEYPRFIGSFRYVKKRKSYEKSNLTFNVETGYAHSYDWYIIAKPVADTLVVNSFKYSRSTSRHYSDILHLARALGYQKILSVEAPRGLQDGLVIDCYYAMTIDSLEKTISNPRSRESANKWRREKLAHLKATYAAYVRLSDSEQFDEELNALLADDTIR